MASREALIMPRTHIIAAGDRISTLAKEYGFANGGQIWNHPLNASLRAARGSADLLMIGDELAIPDAPSDAPVEVMSGTRAVFVLRTSDVLRVRLTGIQPFLDLLGPMPYELRAGSQVVSGTLTDEAQLIELPLADDTTTIATLSLLGRPSFELAIGGLGPLSEGKGAYARLESLGFTAERRPAGEREAAGDPLAAALLRFQKHHGLQATGQLDAPTRAALADAYGD